MEPQLARHPATLPATQTLASKGRIIFVHYSSHGRFYYSCGCTEGKWSCQHLRWACQLIPPTLNTGFGPGPLFFSLNQELSEQEAESCKFILTRRPRYAALMPRLQSMDHLSIRAERSPDNAAAGLPWTERTLQRWKITPCDGWVTLWLLEVLVLSRMAVCLFSSDFTHIWLTPRSSLLFVNY